MKKYWDTATPPWKKAKEGESRHLSISKTVGFTPTGLENNTKKQRGQESRLPQKTTTKNAGTVCPAKAQCRYFSSWGGK